MKLSHCETAIPSCFLTACGSETRAVRHLDRFGRTVQRNSQRVIANYPHSCRCGRGSQGTVTGGGQQEITIDLIVASQGRTLASAASAPKLATAFEYAGRFQLEARYFVRSRSKLKTSRGCTTW